MQRIDGRLIFSPSDLNHFLECEHLIRSSGGGIHVPLVRRWRSHALTLETFDVKRDRRLHRTLRLVSRVPVATQPGMSGEYAEYPSLANQVTILRGTLLSIRMVARSVNFRRDYRLSACYRNASVSSDCFRRLSVSRPFAVAAVVYLLSRVVRRTCDVSSSTSI